MNTIKINTKLFAKNLIKSYKQRLIVADKELSIAVEHRNIFRINHLLDEKARCFDIIKGLRSTS